MATGSRTKTRNASRPETIAIKLPVRPGEPSPYELGTLASSLLRERDIAPIRISSSPDCVTIESGPASDPLRHARLQRLGVKQWRLEMPLRNTRWESTPILGPFDDVLRTLLDEFGWALAQTEDITD